MNKIQRVGMIIDLGLTLVRERDAKERHYQMFEKLIAMGGLYVKFVQLLLIRASSERNDRKYDYNYMLKRAYDSSPNEDIDVRQVLGHELGANITQFKDITIQPVAAGSFGQVYKGTLNTGQVVAVKVLRPSVIEDIDFDMRLLKFVARLVGSRMGDEIDLKQIFSRFASVTKREMDYKREAAYALSLFDKYKDHPQIVIPFTYEQLSSGRVITQDFIEGIGLTDVIVQKDQGIDPQEYVARHLGSDVSAQMIAVGQSMLESMLLDGTSHGDPHPGNIKLLPDNKVALLDFGICAEAPLDKQAFFNVVKEYQKIYDGQVDIEGYTWAILNLFVSDLTNAIKSIDLYNHGQFSEQVFGAVNDAIASIYASSEQNMEQLLDDNNFVRIFSTYINEGNRFGLKLEVEQPEFMRATLLYIAVVTSLGLKKTVLAPVYTNVVNNLSGVNFQSLQRRTTPDQAVTVIAEWLEKVASKDIYLYQMLSSRISSGALHV